MDKFNPEAKKRIRKYFSQMKIMFITIVFGVFLLAFAIWLLTGYGAEALNPDIDGILRFATPISTAALIILSLVLYRGRIIEAKQKSQMHEKMEGFRGGWLLRMMVLDGAGLLNVISFILTCNELYYYLLGAVLFVFVLNFPSAQRFISEMELNSTEEQVIRDHI